MSEQPQQQEPQQQENQRRPVECVFCRGEQRFRVTRSRGKTLTAGGFGTILGPSAASGPGETGATTLIMNGERTEAGAAVHDTASPGALLDPRIQQRNDDNENRQQQNVQPQLDKQRQKAPDHYLFLEEVIYLHERGILHAFWENQPDNVDATDDKQLPLQLSDLYELLPVCNLPLATYLVYQHVRSQTFRVVRHTEQRRAIVQAIQERIQALGDKSEVIATNTGHQLSVATAKRLKTCHTLKHETPKASSDCHLPPSQTKHKGNGENKNAFRSESALEIIDNSTDGEDSVSEKSEDPDACTLQNGKDTDDARSSSRDHEMDLDETIVNASGTTGSRKSWKHDSELRRLVRELRADAARAPPPQPAAVTLAYDCYHPNAHFSSTNPGLPDFYVAVAFYSCTWSGKVSGEPEDKQCFSLDDLQSFLRQARSSVNQSGGASEETAETAGSVTVKVATVSDSGTVIMFGVSDYGVPVITKKG